MYCVSGKIRQLYLIKNVSVIGIKEKLFKVLAKTSVPKAICSLEEQVWPPWKVAWRILQCEISLISYSLFIKTAIRQKSNIGQISFFFFHQSRNACKINTFICKTIVRLKQCSEKFCEKRF